MPTKKLAKGNNAGNAAKAYRLRKKESAGQALEPVDKLWLLDYEEQQQRRSDARGARRQKFAKDIGASRSTRTLKVDLQEEQEAAGTGTAAAVAAAAAIEAREEGRRLDYLTSSGIEAMKESRRELLAATHVYRSICLSLRQRTEVLEATHVAMLEGVREHFAARTEAEMALVRREADDDQNPSQTLMLHMLAQRLGIALPGAPPTRPPPFPVGRGKRPHKAT